MTKDTAITKGRKDQLLARMADLNERLVSIDAELDSHHNPDWEEQAVEVEADEVLEEIGQSGQHEIRQIEAALARLQAGEYGYCTKCGAEISSERLDLLPATPFCSHCAQ